MEMCKKHTTHETGPHSTVFDPETVAAHHVRHHDVSGQSITDNSNLVWPRYTRIRVRSKVGHDFVFAAGLLGRMLQYLDAGVGL